MGRMVRKRFEELLFETPECNDFRMLSNGSWMAYSIILDDTGVTIRHNAPSIREALEGLRKKLPQYED